MSRTLEKLALAFIGLPFLLGILVLLGWATGSGFLVHIRPEWVGVKPMTAISLILLSLADFTMTERQTPSWSSKPAWQYIGLFSLCSSVALSVLVLFECFSGVSVGIDTILFENAVSGKALAYPGRMSPITASIFLCYGLSIAAMQVPIRKKAIWADIFNGLGFLLSFMAILGNLFDVSFLYKMGAFTAIAFVTASASCFLGIGIFLSHSKNGLASTLQQPGAGSQMLRRILPPTIVFPIAIGWIRWQAELHGLIDERFGLVIMILTITVTTSAMVWVVSLQSKRLEESTKSKEFFDLLIEHMPVAVIAKDAKTSRLVHLNGLAEKLLGLKRETALGKIAAELVDPETAFEAVGIGEPFEHVIDSESGSRVLRTRKLSIPALDGKQSIILSIIEDLTDLKGVEVERDIFFATSLDMCVIAGMNGYFKRVNPSCFAILGYTPEELCSIPYLELIHPDDIKATITVIDRQSKGEKILSFENRYRTKDGRYRWLSWRTVSIGDSMYAVARDITEQKVAQEDTRANFEAVAANMSQLAWLADSAGHITWVNKALSEAFGERPSGLLDQTWTTFVHPDDLARYISTVKKALKEGREYYLEYRLKLKGAKSRWFYRHSVPLFGSSGKVSKWVGTCTDITEQKRATKEIAEAKRRTDVVVAHIDGVLWAADDQGIINFFRGRALEAIGLKPEDRIGKSVFDPLTMAPDLATHLQQALQGVKVEFVSSRGGLWFRNYVTPVHRENGSLRGIVGLSLNITGQKDLEIELQSKEKETETALINVKSAIAASKLKSEFLANMSHEIRTPLNGVLGMTELLLGTTLNGEQTEYAEAVKNSAEALLTVVNDILDISKIEAGKFDLDLVEFDLHRTIQDTYKTLEILALKKYLTYTVAGNVELPYSLKGDPNRIRQVLTNLLGNAIKFTPAGGVYLKLEYLSESNEPNCKIRFEVRDTGIGIPEAAREKLFQAFSQADSGVARRYGGTGLGLSICKRLVQLMGGEIGVTSKEGEGSTFWFSLTLEKGGLLSQERKKDRIGSNFAPRAERILLAEDNIINQKLVSKRLEKAGFQVDIACNGREVLNALRKARYDLILMDCQMPEVDGYEATRQVRLANEAFRNIPIIALTAGAILGEKEKCLEVGMNDFLTKPIRTQELMDAIERWLSI